ncbi:MAG: bifunctional GNAT family N-acetyltransferase/carbon-nitrogen hydrolase family protein, partial [Leptospiraceae bacterium]|nr:bifunctional GNAT family N-acetyltransferase/carbon-nitrogen hydrolase family protein [Leptospiraceae bacterium]
MPDRNKIKPSKIKARQIREEDIPALVDCHRKAYSDYPLNLLYDERKYRMQLEAFPEGQFLAEYEGKIIGYATSLIIQLDNEDRPYTYPELTGSGTFSTHDPGGDSLYGADIAVDPEYRGMGVSKKLYELRKKLLTRYNLKRLVAYGRIPGFSSVQGKITGQEYINKVVAGELKDSSLNAHLSAGYEVKKVLLDLVKDVPSGNYCTWLEMPNPNFKPEKRKIAASPIQRVARKIRVCAAQYLMRPIKTWEEFEQCVDFFVDVADSYHCHYLLMPELFTANLFSIMPPDIEMRAAAERLADMTEKYIELFRKHAMDYQLYIIGGSHPVKRDGELYNVAHLFTPSGKIYTQDKLHITPSEQKWWGIRPGEGINIFDTPHGRFAIQICYDIEFPEVSRLLALSGVEAIFVPFSTDDRKAYYRVRYCAQARAVENYLYVAIAGNVGNLPEVKAYLINYGKSAIFTPSDFPFPLHAILGESETNQESVVIQELDLSSLAQQRDSGSVKPLHDR